MNLPKQVLAQAEEIAKFDEAVEKANQEPQDELTGEAAPAPDPQPDPQPDPEPQGPEPAETEEDASFWRAKYMTLQGMFNAEVPRLNAQIRDLKQALDEAAAKAKAPEPAPPAARTKLVTDKDVEEFGTEMIDLARRIAEETVSSRETELQAQIAKLEERNAALEKQVGGVVEKQGVVTRQSYLQGLARQVPDYEAINKDPRWLKWLDEVDPLSGERRQTYLDKAFDAMDADATARLFLLWQKSVEVKSPAPSPLERQVAPGPARAPTQAPAAEKSWTLAEIETFYSDVARGKYRGKEAEQARIENEIDRAIASGRVG